MDAATVAAQDPVPDLRARVSGAVLGADDEGYDEARRVWNGIIDRFPLAVVRVADEEDVVTVVGYARDHGLPLAVRGGGHGVAGYGTVDAGIVIDLAALDRVEVEPEAATVRAGGGARLADVDRATTPHGLVVPLGVVSQTGVGGLTLGGGVGWLTRAYGLTADNLLAATVVTASGERVTASGTEHTDLLWGLRGGGGNFGVVTSFTYRARPLPAPLVAVELVYGEPRWPQALRAWEEWTRELPDAMQSIATFLVPPPELGAGDEPLLVLASVWADPDDGATGERLVSELRAAAPPDEESPEADWVAWQSAFDVLGGRDRRGYWRNTSFDRLDDDVTEVLLRRAGEQRWAGTGIDIHHMGGAFARVPADATPFPARGARFWLNVYGAWTDPALDGARTAWVRAFAQDMAPASTGGLYVNFMGSEPGDRGARAVYGDDTLARLAGLKRRYDPENLFRLNHNVLPA
ncbi:FAD/FMN-containing dehydrogenase [Georgenia satyanarayanai]|uniref:FAD/FMN-containing dehydrogenase n=1 Tax=Georgenia satyanarayanai TaxID=860221 RepID=A0A2Y9AF73_9MICO|nr:FAD-binding oxidoreductase [Georgenia satyanarayanai]PYF99926.1 FAD/FMN-containing dehydrogenase [Georgenia satyanarayanai]SSA41928.1 FAD/FMN-containing dehydrogenase [Georgenia satyanarayanai]